jgi:hypothetical protein
MLQQIVIAADPLAADKGLRRRVDVMLVLEGVGFLARGEPAVIHLHPCRSSKSLLLSPKGQMWSGMTIR